MTSAGAILGLDWPLDSNMLATNNADDMLQTWELGVSSQPIHTYALPQTQSHPRDYNDAVVR